MSSASCSSSTRHSNPTTVQNAANYTVTQTFKQRGVIGGKAVALASAVYDPTTNAVTLTIVGKAAFLTGGKIIVNAQSPGGITDTQGAFLDGTGQGVFGTNATLIISRKRAGSR